MPAAFARTETLALLRERPLSRRAIRTRTSPISRRRSRPAPRAREELHRMVRHFGLRVVEAYMRHVQDNAAEAGAPRPSTCCSDGAFAYEMDDGAVIRVRVAIDRAAPARQDRFHRHERRSGPPTSTRPPAMCMRRGALCLPHARRRRYPDERRLPGAARRSSFRKARCSGPRYPAAVVAGNVETRQMHHRRALWRARRAGRGAGHDEQLHLRQRATSVLRDDLRRLGRGARLRRHRCRPHSHDQHAR